MGKALAPDQIAVAAPPGDQPASGLHRLLSTELGAAYRRTLPAARTTEPAVGAGRLT